MVQEALWQAEHRRGVPQAEGGEDMGMRGEADDGGYGGT